MNRTEARENLSAYLDGELDAAERSAFEAVLAEDAELRDELDALRRTVALVQGLPRLSAPRDLAGRVRAAIDSPVPSTGWVRQWAPIALAAAACLAIGIVALTGPGTREPDPGARHVVEASKPATEAPAEDRVAEELLEKVEEPTPGAAARKSFAAKTGARVPEDAAPAPRAPAAPRLAEKKSTPRPTAAPALGAAVHVARNRGEKEFALRDSLLMEDIRRSPVDAGVAEDKKALAKAENRGSVTTVVPYDDLERCLGHARFVLEAAGATYVVQPVGAGRFTIETALPRAKAQAVLAQLRSTSLGQRRATKAAEVLAEPAKDAAAATGGAVAQQAQAQEEAEDRADEGGAVVQLVLRFESRAAADEAKP